MRTQCCQRVLSDLGGHRPCARHKLKLVDQNTSHLLGFMEHDGRWDSSSPADTAMNLLCFPIFRHQEETPGSVAAGFPPRRPRFDPRSSNVGFVVDIVVLELVTRLLLPMPSPPTAELPLIIPSSLLLRFDRKSIAK